jgi:methionyl-tRNA formyltransferase
VASKGSNSRALQIAAVVSQPGKPKGRGNKSVPIPSPVEQLARESGLADEQIMCPAKAKDVRCLGCLGPA